MPGTVIFSSNHWDRVSIRVVTCADSNPNNHLPGHNYTVEGNNVSVSVPDGDDLYYQREANPTQPTNPPTFYAAWNHIANFGDTKEENIP